MLQGSDATSPPEPLGLKRCDESATVLCVSTFGIEPPDQMLISLLVAPSLPGDLEIHMTQGEATRVYSCSSTEASETILSCLGPQQPLGSIVQIEVYASEGQMLLARGEFTLTAMALPTVVVGGQPAASSSLPTTSTSDGLSASPLPFPTRSATLTPDLSLEQPQLILTSSPTPTFTQASLPGTAYPGPALTPRPPATH